MFSLILYNFVYDGFLSMPVSTFILGSIFSVFIVAVCIVYLLGRFFMFKKMGIEPGKGLIPIYGLYQLGKKIGINWFTLILFLLFAMLALVEFLFSQIYVDSFLYLFAYGIMGVDIIVLILVLATFFYFQFSLSRSFKKSIGYSIGAFFLPAIFNLVFGLCKSKYAGNITKKRIYNIKKQMDERNKEAYEKALQKKKENQQKENLKKENLKKESSINENQLKEYKTKENKQAQNSTKTDKQKQNSIKQEKNQKQNSTYQEKRRIHVRKALKD